MMNWSVDITPFTDSKAFNFNKLTAKRFSEYIYDTHELEFIHWDESESFH